MNKKIYMKNSVIQKVISNETYDILKICKENFNYDKIKNNIQEYILKSYNNEIYYNDVELYRYLLNVVFNLSDDKNLKNILENGINDCFKDKMFKNNLKHTPIDYNDLIHMLINNICLMEFRTKADGEYIDLFLVEDDKQILSSDEYDEKIKKLKQKNYK